MFIEHLLCAWGREVRKIQCVSIGVCEDRRRRVCTARGLREEVPRKMGGKQEAQRQSWAGLGRQPDLGPGAQ